MKTNEFEKGNKFSFGDSIDYAERAVVSKQVIKKEAGNVSLFAFDKGEGLSEHSTPYDALVQILDGRVDISIDGKSNILEAGEAIIMPARIPHALKALERFKMLLTMIKSN